MDNQRSDLAFKAVEEFWKRFSWSMEVWFPDLPSVPQWAEKLKVKADTLYNWKKRNPDGGPPVRPRGKASQLASMYAAADLGDRGGDPWALARYVFTGEGEAPRPAGGTVVPNVSAPLAPAQPVVRGNIIRLLEEGVRRAIGFLPRDPDEAKKTLEGVIRIAHEARQLGLAGLLAFGMLGQGGEVATSAFDDSSRSGGIGRRARFRVGGTRHPKFALSDVRAGALIIKLDDARNVPGEPKSPPRAKTA